MTKPKFPLCAVGNRYGKLVVAELIPMPKNPTARCVCDCGKDAIRQRGALVRGLAVSCGRCESALDLILAAITIETDDCILTPTCRLKSGGYGVVRHDGRNERAHRLAYAHANGLQLADIEDKEIRHKCDNPPCINPRHLVAGTHQDNMDDMYSRGRRTAAVGERASSAKLTTAQVLEIRRRAAAGEPRNKLQNEFGVGQTAIRSVVLRKTWRHV